MSKPEETLALMLDNEGIEYQRKYRFAATCWADYKG